MMLSFSHLRWALGLALALATGFELETYYETAMSRNQFSLAGSHRVLATVVDDWSDNLLALAPVQAYAYVR
jgi:hypothetical protein